MRLRTSILWEISAVHPGCQTRRPKDWFVRRVDLFLPLFSTAVYSTRSTPVTMRLIGLAFKYFLVSCRFSLPIYGGNYKFLASSRPRASLLSSEITVEFHDISTYPSWCSRRQVFLCLPSFQLQRIYILSSCVEFSENLFLTPGNVLFSRKLVWVAFVVTVFSMFLFRLLLANAIFFLFVILLVVNVIDFVACINIRYCWTFTSMD